FFFSSRRRHTRFSRDWSSDVCSSDLFFDPHYFSDPISQVYADTSQATIQIINDFVPIKISESDHLVVQHFRLPRIGLKKRLGAYMKQFFTELFCHVWLAVKDMNGKVKDGIIDFGVDDV